MILHVVVILRHIDSTPVHVVFGELQAQLEQAARYFRPCTQIDPATGSQRLGWEIVDYDEYRRLHPHCRPRVGVLELLAMHGSVAWVPNCPAGQVAPLNVQRFILPPVFLERTTASCVHLVVNTADTTLSNGVALRLARAAGCV